MTSLRQKQIQAHIDEEHRIKHVIITRLKKNIGSHLPPDRRPDAKINNSVEKTSSKLVDILHEALKEYSHDLQAFQYSAGVQRFMVNLPAVAVNHATTLLNQFHAAQKQNKIFDNSLGIFKKYNDIIREYSSPSISSVDRSNIKTMIVKIQPIVKSVAIGLENLFYGITVHMTDPGMSPQAEEYMSNSIAYTLKELSLFVNINDMIYYDKYQLLSDSSLKQVKEEYLSQLNNATKAILLNTYNETISDGIKYTNGINLPRLK